MHLPPKATTDKSHRQKQALREELAALMLSQLDVLERSQRNAHEGSIHEEAKPEDDKDTRALEQSYLARGQATRIDDLRAGIAGVQAMPVRAFGKDEAVGVGALVTLEDDDDGSQLVVFVAAHGGGSRLAKGKVQVATPKSPLGQALMERTAGDGIELTGGAASVATRQRTASSRSLTLLRVE